MAQGNGSDNTGPGGGGSGLAGSLGIGVKGAGAGAGAGAGGSRTLGGTVTGQASGLAGTSSAGESVSNPATGTTVVVPQAVAAGLGAVLAGQTTGAGPAAFLASLAGSMDPALATDLVQKLAALGSHPTPGSLRAAIVAYNNAVKGLTGAVPSGLLAVRAALLTIR
jgi:hypothetical protein